MAGSDRRGDALEREDRAEPQASEHRQVQAADVLGQVRRACSSPRRPAYSAGVGQRPDTAGVQDDDEGAAARRAAFSLSPRSPAGAPLKYTSFSRSAERWV